MLKYLIYLIIATCYPSKDWKRWRVMKYLEPDGIPKLFKMCESLHPALEEGLVHSLIYNDFKIFIKKSD